MTGTLKVDDLRIVAGDRTLVEGVSFAAAPGEALTILGESGSGKSLVSHAVMGTLPAGLAATGEITIDGVATPVTGDRRRLWGRKLALLPQEPWRSLDPTMRALAQVAEGCRGDRAGRRTNADRLLDALHVGAARHLYPWQLSGGLAQRVAFAATSARGAELMIIDEPTKGLDAVLRDQLVALLVGELGAGRTLLTITHDVHVARALGGRVVVMLDGRVVDQGVAADILDHPAHDYTRRLLAADPARWPERPPARTGGRLLTATGLSQRFGDHALFEDLDVALDEGARVAIVGPSGSGKTTLGNILIGLAVPTHGRVERAPGLPATGFQKLYQDPPAAFPPRVTLRRSMSDLAARIGARWSAVEALLARLRLAPHLLDRFPDQVSGGELQRLALLRILLVEPALIFADEATSRLDPLTQQGAIEVLVEETARRGCALLLVTHDAALGRSVAGDDPIRLSHDPR